MDAFIYEHGPFIFSLNATASSNGGGGGGGSADPAAGVRLAPNPYSWSKAASVLYVDSPAGTGFSYSEEPKRDYSTGDRRTVADLTVFLTRLYEQIPRLALLDLYIAGESYAGVYVPLLARELVGGPQARGHSARDAGVGGVGGGASPGDRLAGYLIGNGVTDDEYDGQALVPFAYGMDLIDPATHAGVERACGGVFWNATKRSPCGRALSGMESLFSRVNIYSILDPCFFRPRASGAGGGDAESGDGGAVLAAARAAAADPRRWPFTGASPHSPRRLPTPTSPALPR